jgi:hypothetical protein
MVKKFADLFSRMPRVIYMCQKHTLREEITLVRAEITSNSVKIPLVLVV